MKDFVLSPAAMSDLAEIEEYLESKRPDAVDGILDGIESACALVANYPGVGRTRDEIDPGLLSFPIGSYIIFYYQGASPLGIARILHGSRDLGPTFHDV